MHRLRQAAEPQRKVTFGEIVSEVADQVRLKARDHGRMPMPWDASNPNAGFSDAEKLWTRMNTDSSICNVADQQKRPGSVLKFWQRMLAFRRQHAETLVFGDLEPVGMDDGPVFCYRRTPLWDAREDTKKMLVVLNLTNHSDIKFTIPTGIDGASTEYRLFEATSVEKHGQRRIYSGDEVVLQEYEGLILSY